MDSVIGLISDFGILHLQWGQFLMIVIGMILLYLAIVKGFEPLLLVPIGLGGILSNLPDANLAINAVDAAIHAGKADVMQAFAQILNVVESTPDAIKHAVQMATPEQKMHLGLLAEQYQYSDGMLYTFYHVAIASGVGPLVIFMGVGAMTDFGPLLANPKTLLLGAAAQFGIFATVLGALGLTQLGIMDFSVAQAAAIGIIGGADGPTAIYVSSLLAPELLGAIAVAAYSYMALVPMIQPPIMRALTTEAERKIEMKQLAVIRATAGSDIVWGRLK